MKLTSEETFGLCRDLRCGNKYKIRKKADAISGRFKDGEEVEITDFVEGHLPCCKNVRARLLKFKGHSDKGAQWHPLWIINCPACLFYDPMLEESSHVRRFTRATIQRKE